MARNCCYLPNCCGHLEDGTACPGGKGLLLTRRLKSSLCCTASPQDHDAHSFFCSKLGAFPTHDGAVSVLRTPHWLRWPSSTWIEKEGCVPQRIATAIPLCSAATAKLRNLLTAIFCAENSRTEA